MHTKEEHFKELIAENEERLVRICRYYHSNAEGQKDLYQEILVNIWKSLDKFRGESSINTWIYRIAVNTAISFSGKSYRHAKLMINTDSSAMNILYDHSELEGKLEQEALFEQLQVELNQLSIIDKALISLLLEGLTMKEIGNVIGITEPNVKVKIHRIKSQLKEKLVRDE
jgi:RNA polymerase sigma-70 factor, ECF subfamily